MNERIKELVQQTDAWCDQNYAGDKFYDVRWEEKFAKLIVRECANICFSEAEGHSMAFGEHCGVVIKEHFGVE
jgi:hypothetical protein